MDGNRRRHKRLVANGALRIVESESGQGSVEYAVVLAAILCVIVALGLLANSIEGGLFVEHALAAASHHVQASLGWISDVFIY